MPPALLPQVRPVGTVAGRIAPDTADRYCLCPDLALVCGATDSIAAFLATGAGAVGDAVTSLGTTLVIKVLSDRRIDDPARGVYSHKVGPNWLVGGASNTGGGVLLDHFTPDDLTRLSARIDPDDPTGLHYYPLSRPGERFPVNDPHLVPVLSPRPASDARFRQALFEGIAEVEALSYRTLEDLAAPRAQRILTVGGGARNVVWQRIRQRIVPADICAAPVFEASVGMALLARSALAVKSQKVVHPDRG